MPPLCGADPSSPHALSKNAARSLSGTLIASVKTDTSGCISFFGILKPISERMGVKAVDVFSVVACRPAHAESYFMPFEQMGWLQQNLSKY